MAYDEGLAHRLDELFEGRSDVQLRKMFGGLCYMVRDHMCCGIVGDRLMARVGPERYDECLSHAHAREMDFTGKALKGMIYVLPGGIESDEDLNFWVGQCERFVASLPPRKPK